MEYYCDTSNQHLKWNTKNLATNYKFGSSPMNSFNQRRSTDQVPFGGFAWPPRSYTCSFCKREFRSAQALGGHMNVHRRDRARLNQSESIPIREKKLSVRRSCLVYDDDDTAELVVNDYKRHKTSDQRLFGKWSSSAEEIDLELRLGSDPTAVK